MTQVKMPEPVAKIGSTFQLLWFGARTITEISDQSGTTVGSLLITTDQAEAYAAAKVREALEEAGQILETIYEESLSARVSEDEDDEAWNLTCIARAQSISQAQLRIRALIPQHDNE